MLSAWKPGVVLGLFVDYSLGRLLTNKQWATQWVTKTSGRHSGTQGGKESGGQSGKTRWETRWNTSWETRWQTQWETQCGRHNGRQSGKHGGRHNGSKQLRDKGDTKFQSSRTPAHTRGGGRSRETTPLLPETETQRFSAVGNPMAI